MKRIQQALALAQELSHPLSLAWALFCAAVLHRYRQEWQVTQERAEALITLSTEQGFPHWVLLGTIIRSWAVTRQGQREKEIELMRQSLAAWQAMGAELNRPHCLALLAEACASVARVEDGLAVLDEALAAVHQTGEQFYKAELYRLKGELTLQREFKVPGSKFQVADSRSLLPDPRGEAESCYLKAIEVARKQSAKLLELRAVMSLCRLWQQDGKKGEARQLLVEIYNWFTEGFDTADLKDAQALLEELT